MAERIAIECKIKEELQHDYQPIWNDHMNYFSLFICCQNILIVFISYETTSSQGALFSSQMPLPAIANSLNAVSNTPTTAKMVIFSRIHPINYILSLQTLRESFVEL